MIKEKVGKQFLSKVLGAHVAHRMTGKTGDVIHLVWRSFDGQGSTAKALPYVGYFYYQYLV